MELLVTGGAGFIGRNLIRQLLADGHRVTSLDSFKIGGPDFLPGDIIEPVQWVKGDSGDRELVERLVRGKDAVIHLAAPSSFLMYEEDPIDGATATTLGFLNVLEAMRKNSVETIVYASTSAVYEGNPVPYHEEMPIDPPDLKALSKKWNEEAAHQYSERYGIRAVGLRPFSVYGHDEFSKGGYANIISLFVWAILNRRTPVVWGDGSQTRDFIHVDDAARAFRLALRSSVGTSEFNVGTGVETTFNEAIAMISEEVGTPVQPRYVPVPIMIYAERLWADTKRAEDTLGFKPEIDVRQGVRTVVEATRAADGRWPGLDNMQMYFEGLAEAR